MNESTVERLFSSIGGIEDVFLEEAETVDIAGAKADRRRQMVKYGAFGAAGLAAVSAGVVVAWWKLFRPNRIANSA